METILATFTWLEGVYLFCFLLGLGFVIVTFLMGMGGHGASVASDHEPAGVEHDVGGVEHDTDFGHGLGGEGHDLAHEIGPGDTAAAEHAEAFHAGYGEAVGGFRLGPFSPTVISFVLCCFGGTGMLLIYSPLMSAEPWRYVSLAPALASGLVLGTVMMLGFNRIFSSIEASSEVKVGSLIGHEATVTTPIPADGVGEIATTARGARWTGAARSANGQPIGKYEKVVIQDHRRHVCYVLPAERKPNAS
jgi:hypothetical protein